MYLLPMKTHRWDVGLADECLLHYTEGKKKELLVYYYYALQNALAIG